MSQHNITGSEVFGPKTLVIVKSARAGGFRKRKSGGTVVAFVAGAVVAVVGGAVALAAVMGPTLFG